MTVRYAVSGGNIVVLDPGHYDLPYGSCVQFVNQAAAMTTITVGDRYSQTLGPSENTTSSTNYRATAPGRQPVTATSGPAGSSAHGSLTVAAAPAQSPSPTPSSHPRRTVTPTPAAPPPSSSGTGPQVAPTPSRSRRPSHHRSGLQPPVSPAGPVQTQIPTPSPSAVTVVAGPIEPPSGRGVGLPAALAALAVLGCGIAFVRVLAAEPVDSAETVGGRA
jgi:hypothetical protein